MKQENKQSQIDSKSEEKIIREGIIDVAAIDVNKDGKIFQCQMDWNVINDKKGICPTCGMELEEVTVAKAKENLVMNDYNVK
jgi:Cu(I)/Ag(I) efflux system membrane fusion protein/cobalt-zinc-cadmium efflux system membrane fusion protein